MNLIISSQFKISMDIMKDGFHCLTVGATNIKTGEFARVFEVEKFAEFRLGDVVRALDGFAATSKAEEWEGDFYPALICQIEQYKSNIYEYHLNKAVISERNELIFLFEWYVRQFSVEIMSLFSGMATLQRTLLETSIVKGVAEVDDDYSEVLELKMLYGAWKKQFLRVDC